MGERMNELRELGMMWMWAMMGCAIVAWYIGHRIDEAAQVHYWRGRKDGFDLHRRMINNKVKTNEVFDYDKN